MSKYKAPFPWFGGKSRVGHIVWALLGDVKHYLEPFFGSGAVLFLRPKNHKNNLETVNDKDMLIANFWRAVQKAPDEVAYYADYPVNEADLTARHIWLVKYGIPDLELKIQANPDYYDAKIAGWWVWGISQWIGNDWCLGNGRWTEKNGIIVEVASKNEKGVSRTRPSVSRRNTGILSSDDVYDFIRQLSERLRHVRIVCGDWSRLVTKGVLSINGIKGIFLDPPYYKNERHTNLYRVDENISKLVNQWCVENGDNPRYRIVLCGYEGEHNNLEELGWKKIAWVAKRAYGTSKGDSANAENRFKERIWYNKSCLAIE